MILKLYHIFPVYASRKMPHRKTTCTAQHQPFSIRVISPFTIALV